MIERFAPLRSVTSYQRLHSQCAKSITSKMTPPSSNLAMSKLVMSNLAMSNLAMIATPVVGVNMANRVAEVGQETEPINNTRLMVHKTEAIPWFRMY